MTADAYAELAADVLRRPARFGDARLVCVDGPSGAGKSSLATALAAAITAALRTPVPVIRIDDHLDGWGDQFTFWDRLERQVLGPLRRGGPATYRPYNWDLRRFGDVTVTVEPAPVVILEGVSSARAAARAESTLTIFVAAPRELRTRRLVDRDGPGVLPYLDAWQQGEDRHFAEDATAHHVDLLVDGATGYVRRGGNRPAGP